MNSINVNGNDVPDPIEDFVQLKTKTMWADEQIPATLIDNLLAYKYARPSPVQMQAIPTMLNVSSLN